MAAMLPSLVVLCLFWAIVNGLARLLRRKPTATRASNDGLLPTTRASTDTSWTSVGPCWLIWQTTSFNAKLEKLAKRLELQRVYVAGSWLVAVLQPVAVVALFFVALRQLPQLLSQAATEPKRLVKRVLEKRDATAGGIQAVIPGVTIPLSEAPLMLLGLFASAVVHEAGHAFAAVHEGVSLDAVGVFLALVFPGAFVSLAAAPLDLLPPQGKLRIWTAGILHNLVLALALFALSNRGLGTLTLLQRLTLFRDESQQGVVVQSVLPFSLKPFLTTGTLITQLDDYDMHDSDERNHWKDFLADTNIDRFASMGWCLTADAFEKTTSRCCDDKTSTLSAETPICFASAKGSHCLPASQVITAKPANPRCVDLCPGDDTYCLTPDTRSQLLRLTVVPLGSSESVQILYRGSKEALLRNVAVGRLQPRFGFVPASIPHLSERLLQHTISASLALAAFNLLPIRRLDGEAILEALIESEALPRGMTSFLRRSRFTLEICCAGAAALLAVVTFGRALL